MVASDLIRMLKLTPHPEGGHYREIGRSEEIFPRSGLPARYDGDRSLYTSIYYLLQQREISRLHRLRSDELWCLLAGGPLVLHCLTPEDGHTRVRLGPALEEGEHFEAIVPHGRWFGAVVEEPGEFALMSCTVVPGFEFRDFELGERQHLLAAFPAYHEIIELLT